MYICIYVTYVFMYNTYMYTYECMSEREIDSIPFGGGEKLTFSDPNV
jgi:hypothetical protein